MCECAFDWCYSKCLTLHQDCGLWLWRNEYFCHVFVLIILCYYANSKKLEQLQGLLFSRLIVCNQTLDCDTRDVLTSTRCASSETDHRVLFMFLPPFPHPANSRTLMKTTKTLITPNTDTPTTTRTSAPPLLIA